MNRWTRNLSMFLLSVQWAPAGMIAGRVLRESGAPVVNAHVTALAEFEPESQKVRAYTGTARTGKGGEFVLGDVPPGRYRLCAAARATLLLNPCLWEMRPVSVVLGYNATLDTAVIYMKEGHLLEVELDDPQELLDQYEKKTTGATLRIGIAPPGTPPYLVGASVTDKKKRTYRMVIPYDIPVRVHARGGRFRLRDDDGPMAANGKSTRVLVKKSEALRGLARNKLNIRVEGFQ